MFFQLTNENDNAQASQSLSAAVFSVQPALSNISKPTALITSDNYRNFYLRKHDGRIN
jgi:hypothetical protein